MLRITKSMVTVKGELGDQSNSRSYWTLFVKDVIPDSRSKSFAEHSPQSTWSLRSTVTALLMYHVKKERSSIQMTPVLIPAA